MKKRVFAAALALMLLLSGAALAEKETIKARTVNLNAYSGAMAIRAGDSQYYDLYSPSGEKLTSVQYREMSTRYHETTEFFEVRVESEDGIHNTGLIDSAGRVVLPPVYADVTIVSDRWQVGIKLTPCDAEDKDYTYSSWSSDEKQFFRIDTVDLYLDKQLIGSLPRSQYDGVPTPHGAFICINDRSRQHFFYGKDMVPHPSQTTREYGNESNGGLLHQPTGQIAFTPACTLTPEDVETSVAFMKNTVYDLQGNVAATTTKNYEYVYAMNHGYWRTKLFGKTGVLDSALNEIIPPEYDDVDINTDMSYGRIGVVRDGKFGFVDFHNNVTCDFVYGKDIVYNKGTMAYLKDLDGSYIVLSSMVGQLPERYKSVTFNGMAGSMAFVAEKADEGKGLVGINGQVLIPFSKDNRDIAVTNDGRVAVVTKGSQTFDIYRFPAIDLNGGANSASPAAPADPASPAAPAAPEADTWTCENGHTGNTGKFCSECCAAKPEPKTDDGSWTCVNGHSGNTGKFCSECGAPKPEDNGPWTCVNGHTGNTGKFCAECGAARP